MAVFGGGVEGGGGAQKKGAGEKGEEHTCPPLRMYAVIELLIGASAIIVPHELQLGHGLLERLGSTSSAGYYLFAGIWVAFTLIPWSALMGATIPVAMLAIQRMYPENASRSFSYLYTANVAGALAV